MALSLMRCLAEKNAHEIKALCEQYGASSYADSFIALIGAYGESKSAIEKIGPLCQSEGAKRALGDLKKLCELLSKTEYAQCIRLDFSVVGEGNYYDDIVFKGFIDGIGESVLSGGRYDRLLARMGKKSGAIGFAVYLDLLEELCVNRRTMDVDVVVLYDDSIALSKVAETVRDIVAKGESASAQKTVGELRYKRIVDLRGGVQC